MEAAASHTGDLGIRDGRIVEGTVIGTAKQTIDADGAIVTPATDIHPYDGQVVGRRDGPVSLRRHDLRDGRDGGVGFAPVLGPIASGWCGSWRASKTSRGRALWDPLGWETFPEYMDFLDQMPYTIDFMARYYALRVYVMRDRAVSTRTRPTRTSRGCEHRPRPSRPAPSASTGQRPIGAPTAIYAVGGGRSGAQRYRRGLRGSQPRPPGGQRLRHHARRRPLPSELTCSRT